MKVNVLLLLKSGVVIDQHVVTNTGTAEATFESLAVKAIGQEEFDEVTEGVYDYAQMFEVFNQYASSLGYEIIWLEDLNVNKF